MPLPKKVIKSLMHDIEIRGGLFVYRDHWKTNILDSIFLTDDKTYGIAGSYRKRQCQNITTSWKKNPRRYWTELQELGIDPHEQTKARYNEFEAGVKVPSRAVIWYPFSTDRSVSTACSNILKVEKPGPPPKLPESPAPATPAPATPAPASPSTTRQSTRNRSEAAREEASTTHPTSPELERDSSSYSAKMSSKKKSTQACANEEQSSSEYPPDFDEKRCRKSKQEFAFMCNNHSNIHSCIPYLRRHILCQFRAS